MKAGLCVRYDCNNYGSMLQILATQKAIIDAGWEYEIIRYDKKTVGFYLSNISRLFNPYFMKGKITAYKKRRDIKKYPDIQRNNSIRNKCIEKYRKKYIKPFSSIYKGYKNLIKGAENYDAVIVGSDQLWTPAGIKSKFYNLLFVPDYIKKISFSTSFGVGSIPKSQRKETKRYLERIDYLSVREKRGAEIVEELTGRKATVALDPTLLYTGEEWRGFLPEKELVKDPYIFAFFLGGNAEHRDAVEKLKRDTGFTIVTIPFMDTFVNRDITFGDKKLYEIGPAEFLNLIRGAEYICTDSFHGSVFSILNHKKFITFNRTSNNDKQTRNSRIDSLFSLLSLEDRRFDNNMSITTQINMAINYDDVDSKLEKLRYETRLFLLEALSK